MANNAFLVGHLLQEVCETLRAREEDGISTSQLGWKRTKQEIQEGGVEEKQAGATRIEKKERRKKKKKKREEVVVVKKVVVVVVESRNSSSGFASYHSANYFSVLVSNTNTIKHIIHVFISTNMNVNMVVMMVVVVVIAYGGT
ncbi:hypothetical protein M0804_002949 [Polistes exclamans]|nr:hypothetical protein M0804_002949 [Polistes exclamans]